ncbi:histidine phosphatase family protein [Streptomyces sp. cg36]|uniref:histidine phosphatase family protein n=1 Tax=Streptomyces sp. cg36 TaxID=3238798 RepID=UPI0034E2C9D7
MGELFLIRHGETEWSRQGKHTGRTDLPLTRLGEAQAQALQVPLTRCHLALALVSPLQRAQRTAQLAGISACTTEPELREWDYGGCEGLTTPEIRTRQPGWSLWHDGPVPGGPGHLGETLVELAERCERVLRRVTPLLRDTRRHQDVALVAHGHVLRVLAARYLGLPPENAAMFTLGPASVSRLGTEHGDPAVLSWNVPAPFTQASSPSPALASPTHRGRDTA